MGAQDRTEKVLRDIHVLFSKAESYQGRPTEVIVNKNDVMNLLKELNECMYEMMDEHELSQRKKDKANREMQKQGDDIIFAASRKAEDIYAASIMYTDNALNRIQDIMTEANQAIEKIYQDTKEQVDEQRRTVKTNQSELKSELEELIDTQKYLRLIEDENRRQQSEKESGSAVSGVGKASSTYAAIQPEIKINKEYFIQNGIPLDEEEPAATSPEGKPMSEEELAAMAQELDREYFDWKEESKPEGEKSFSLFSEKINNC